jgi:hypothetical protein
MIPLYDEAWIGQITLNENFTLQHVSQFIELWAKLRDVHPFFDKGNIFISKDTSYTQPL